MKVELTALVRSARDVVKKTAAGFGISQDVLAALWEAQKMIDLADVVEASNLPLPREIAAAKTAAKVNCKALVAELPKQLPTKCVRALASAYGAIEMTVAGLRRDDPGPQEAAELMQMVMLLIGSAIAHADPEGDTSEAVNRLWAERGKKGGQKRHASTNAVKVWARREAETMRGCDKSIARQLSDRIPAELRDDSDKDRDYVRLIYEDLRAQRKLKASIRLVSQP